jgi:hypothetical protein
MEFFREGPEDSNENGVDKERASPEILKWESWKNNVDHSPLPLIKQPTKFIPQC